MECIQVQKLIAVSNGWVTETNTTKRINANGTSSCTQSVDRRAVDDKTEGAATSTSALTFTCCLLLSFVERGVGNVGSECRAYLYSGTKCSDALRSQRFGCKLHGLRAGPIAGGCC